MEVFPGGRGRGMEVFPGGSGRLSAVAQRAKVEGMEVNTAPNVGYAFYIASSF